MELRKALEQIDFDFFARSEDGKLFPQSTKPEAVAKGIEMLDPQQGHHVLEVGTGSGYSTALIATMVGNSGKVTTIDIDPKLTERAKSKLAHFSWIKFISGDGRLGDPSNAPFDRIIAWATPEKIPDAWKNQIKEGGVIVTPFQVLPYAGCTVTTRLVYKYGALHGELVSEEGYILMSDDPSLNTTGIERQADFMFGNEKKAWVSSDWAKTYKSLEWGKKFLQAEPLKCSVPKGMEIRPYLLSLIPKGFTFAYHPDHGYWLGYSTPNGFAFLSYHFTGKQLVTDKVHKDVLDSWINQWENLGKPSYDKLLPVVIGDQIKIELKKNALK